MPAKSRRLLAGLVEIRHFDVEMTYPDLRSFYMKPDRIESSHFVATGQLGRMNKKAIAFTSLFFKQLLLF